jgi:hypothetical protein
MYPRSTVRILYPKTSVEIRTHERDSYKKGTALDRTVVFRGNLYHFIDCVAPSQKEMTIL